LALPDAIRRFEIVCDWVLHQFQPIHHLVLALEPLAKASEASLAALNVGNLTFKSTGLAAGASVPLFRDPVLNLALPVLDVTL
jgi:hypothetical protein